MRGYSTTVSGTCGLGVFYNFSSYCYYNTSLATISNDGGCSFAVAGFVNTVVCKTAYAELTARFKIVYQSPVRVNANSGNRFFFVIYDTKKVKV